MNQHTLTKPYCDNKAKIRELSEPSEPTWEVLMARRILELEPIALEMLHEIRTAVELVKVNPANAFPHWQKWSAALDVEP